MAKKKKHFVNIHEDDKKTVRWSILYFYGSYGLFYLIAILYREILPDVTLKFYIAEIEEQVTFTMQLAESMDLILLGFAFSLNAYRTWVLLQKKVPLTEKKGFVPFLIAIIILNFAVISHMIANQLNEFMHSIETTYGEAYVESIPMLENLRLGLYFWDEIFSHLLTGFGFFMLTFIFIRLDRKNGEEFKLESKSLKLISFLVGMGVSAGLIEGQAATVYLVVAIVVFIISIFGKRNNPFTYASWLMALGYIIFTIAYGAITGLKETYPFIKQFSELYS